MRSERDEMCAVSCCERSELCVASPNERECAVRRVLRGEGGGKGGSVGGEVDGAGKTADKIRVVGRLLPSRV